MDFVTSCTFGGKRLTDLYMTTASVGLSKGQLDQQQHAGGIYKCQTWVEGLSPDQLRGLILHTRTSKRRCTVSLFCSKSR